MTVRNAGHWLARFTTACAMGFVTFILVLGTLLPMAVLIGVWLTGGK